ncbi:MAG: periplasmic divalent cation tolerance protein [Candidatus Omnitrophota bacterium]|jgi:periplasmic divalent cation tolerance protein
MYIVVFVTAKNLREANKIADTCVKGKLVACANVVKGVSSVFMWDNKMTRENEVLVMMKSQKKLFKRIMATIKEIHSYDVPEIIAIPIADGNLEYLNWIRQSTKIM